MCIRDSRIIARVHLSDKKAGEKVTVAIPGLKINAELTTDAEGRAETVLNAKRLQRWSPEEPKLYGVTVSSSADRVEDVYKRQEQKCVKS